MAVMSREDQLQVGEKVIQVGIPREEARGKTNAVDEFKEQGTQGKNFRV